MKHWFRLNTGPDKSIEAVEDAERGHAEVIAQKPEIIEVTGQLRRIRQKNHFSEQLASIMTRG